MCLGGKQASDNSGEIAAAASAKKAADIKAADTQIDQAFGTTYTPEYYDNIDKAYTSYYNPQIKKHYDNAVNSLTFQLAQQGILGSSEGSRQLALLADQNTKEQQTIADQAAAASNSAKQQVSAAKNNLYNQANAASDPSSIATNAAEQASSAVTPITYSPLANAFAGLLGQGTNALAVQQGGGISTNSGGSGQLPAFYQPTSLSGSGSGNNGKVV